MIATKKGYTLSELMIAIVLVGVLAAIVIPIIVNVSPSSSKVMFKKEHAVLENAISNMINDDLRYPASETALSSYGATVQKGFNYTTILTTGLGAMNMPPDTDINKFCYLLGNNLDTIAPIDKNSCKAAQNGTFTTSDGAAWTIFQGTFPVAYNNFSTKIVIDVNGTKTPNCFTDTGYASYKPVVSGVTYTSCTKNPDTFIIGVRYDGKLQIGSSAGADTNAEDILKSQMDNKQDN